MKRTLLLSLVVLVYFSSCSKSDSGSGASGTQTQFTATVGGVVKTFDTNYVTAFYHKDTIQTNPTVLGNSLVIVADASSSSTANEIVLAVLPLSSTGAVGTGTYTETSTTSYWTGASFYNTDSSASQAYIANWAGIVYPLYPATMYLPYFNVAANSATTNPLSITISTLDASHVVGTYKGDFWYAYQDGTGNLYVSKSTKQTITGTFTARISQ